VGKSWGRRTIASHSCLDNLPSFVCGAGLDSSAIDVPSMTAAVIADMFIIGGILFFFLCLNIL
jgi:hypothetical protein